MQSAKPLAVSFVCGMAVRIAVPMALESGGERYLYHAMSRLFPFGGCVGYQCFRFAAPLLASFLPLQTIDAFVVVGLTCEVLSGVMMWHLAKRFGLGDRACLHAVLWFWTTWGAIGAAREALLIPDPVQVLCGLTALLLLLDRRYWTALPVLVAGACTKETPVAIPILYVIYLAIAGERRPSLAWLAALIAIPAFAWIATRRFLVAAFHYSGTADVAYVLRFYTLNLWLHELGPWPRNVGIALLYVFAAFGAAWALGVLGYLRSANRQLRALALATVPVMGGFALLQEPHRALNAFPFAILLPAGAYSATLSPPTVATLLAANAVLTLRMAGKVPWLPPAPVMLVAVGALTLWCVRSARDRVSVEIERSPHPATPPIIAIAIAVVSAVLIAVAAVRVVSAERATTVAILPPDGGAIVDDQLGTPAFAVSPSGDRLVFLARGRTGVEHLWVRSLASGVTIEVTGTDRASAPFWSPDGSAIAFFADARLKAVDVSSGAQRDLAPAPDPHGGSWGRDAIVFASGIGGGLQRVSWRGGDVTDAATVDGDDPRATYRWPSFLPDGRRFLFVERNSTPVPERVRIAALGATSSHRLLDGPAESLSYTQPGVVVYGRYEAIRFQAFDLRRTLFAPLETVLVPRVAEARGVSRAAFSAASGVLAYAPQSALFASQRAASLTLTWIDRAGNREPAEPDAATRFALGDARQLPLWSRDRRRFVVARTNGAATDLIVRASGSSAHDEIVIAVPGEATVTDWTPDGRGLLYTSLPTTAVGALFLVSAERGARPQAVVPNSSFATQGQISPDGRWIAYAAHDREMSEVFVQAFPSARARWLVSSDGGNQPRWASDRELIYVTGDRHLMSVAITSADGVDAGRPRRLVDVPMARATAAGFQYAIGPDGRFLVNALAPPLRGAGIEVLLNWRASLGRIDFASP